MKKIFSLFAALTLSVGLWAANSVITFTSTSKLYPGDLNGLIMDYLFEDGAKWEAFKVQYPEFADIEEPMELETMDVGFFNPNCFLDANGQVLPIVEGGVTYDDATKTGTITFAGELVKIQTAFKGCLSLTSITLPEGLTSIGEYSFNYCNNLTTVNLPASLTTIDMNAFDYCLSLTSVNFAENSQLTTIGMYAFNNCSSLATITIPASVTNIGWAAIRSCTSLTDVYVAWTTTLPTLGNTVFDATPVSTATLHVPAGTKTLYQNADQWKDFGSIVEPAPTPVSTSYIDENGEEQNIDAFEVKDASEAVTWGTAGQTTWFVVKGTNVQLAKGAICAGDVRLILADNAKLTATGDNDAYTPGIQVSGDGNSLTIYAQSVGEQMGKLIATGGKYGAGIGGGNSGSGSNITINGGKVTATGAYGAAGIGGGKEGYGSNITINGGVIEATSGSGAAGIGGGKEGSGSYITINGGTVTATGSDGTGIGGGVYGSGSNITINGGEVTATSGGMAAGIGGGMMGSAVNIFVATSLVVKADGNNPPTTVIENDGTELTEKLEGRQYVTIEPKPLPVSTTYLDENGVEQNIDAWEVKDASETVTWGTAGQTTWFVVKGTNVQLSKGAVCAGDVRLILADGAKLTAEGGGAGIAVTGTNSLTIYGQSTGDQMGQLEATGGMFAAGIGGGRLHEDGSNITINGGKVTAIGEGGGAGIGGGDGIGWGTNIIINGGIVIAQGASGIGGGSDASGSDIYISDAYVLKAGADADNTEVIAHSSATDLGSTLKGKGYVKIEGLATPYTRTTSVDQWATVCLPYAASSFSGADFYKVNYYDGVDKLYIEPVDNLVAGMPYIFHTTATTVTIEHNATAPEAVTAGNENGLYGSFARKTIAYDAEHAFAALANNTVNVIEEGHTVTVPACRAYFDMKQVPTSEQPHSAPLRCIGVPRQNPTSLDKTLDTKHQTQKLLHNGQFVIIRDGKTYNAQGIEL